MKSKLLLSLFTLLIACPTPPENVSGNKPNQPEQNNVVDATQNPIGAPPPQGTADNKQPNDNPTNPENPIENNPNQNAKQEGMPPGQPPETPEENKPPEGGIITDSLLILVQKIPNKSNSGLSQEDVINGDHVTFSGSAKCSECEEKLFLRVVRFIGPNASPTNNDIITEKEVSTGDFSIAVPKGEESVALELLVDTDNNRVPSIGERFAVIEMGGQLIPTANKGNLVLDATKRDTFKPAPIPNGAPE